LKVDFLANSTNSRAYVTVLRPSLCRVWRMYCV